MLEKPDSRKLEEAYAAIIMQKVLAATAKMPTGKFPTTKSRATVEEYYDAATTMDEIEKVFYPVIGRLESCHAKCAHLVPWNLSSSSEVSHLHGVGELALPDPRNGTLVLFVSLIIESSNPNGGGHTGFNSCTKNPRKRPSTQGKIAIIPIPGTAKHKASE